MASEKPTKEELQKLREQQINLARQTLENKVFQNILGSNHIKRYQNTYGELAVQGSEGIYQEAMNGEEAQKVRMTLYKRAKEKGDHLGAYGEPTIGNYETSSAILEQMQENKVRLPLEVLVEIVNGISPGFELEMPKKLKKYDITKIQKKLQIAELTEREAEISQEEADVLNLYEIASQAYDRAVVLSTMSGAYFLDINAASKEITDRYKPKKKE